MDKNTVRYQEEYPGANYIVYPGYENISLKDIIGIAENNKWEIKEHPLIGAILEDIIIDEDGDKALGTRLIITKDNKTYWYFPHFECESIKLLYKIGDPKALFGNEITKISKGVINIYQDFTTEFVFSKIESGETAILLVWQDILHTVNPFG